MSWFTIHQQCNAIQKPIARISTILRVLNSSELIETAYVEELQIAIRKLNTSFSVVCQWMRNFMGHGAYQVGEGFYVSSCILT